MAAVTIELAQDTTLLDEMALKKALQSLAKNFSKENIKYLAELSEKPGANEKFNKLKVNPMVKSFL